MALTPIYNIPSPEPAEVADGPAQIGALAQAVEDLLTIGDVNLTAGGTIRVARPRLPDEAVRLQDLGTAISGTRPLAPVGRATTAPVTTTGLVPVDGSPVTVGMRVLVKDQVDEAQNGVYTASLLVWPRAADADTAGELRTGTVVLAQGGAVNAGQTFMCLTDEATDPWDPGVDTNRWFQYLTPTADQRYVLRGGDTMEGPLILDAPPVAALGAATKGYVDLTPDVFYGTSPTPPLVGMKPGDLYCQHS